MSCAIFKDTFGDGRINYTEFLAATIETQGQITQEKLKEAFRYLDRDESGFISRDVSFTHIYRFKKHHTIFLILLAPLAPSFLQKEFKRSFE